MCECVVDIIMWKFAFLVHLLIGIIAVVFCTLFLLPRFSVFFPLFWLCQSDLRIYNVKISSENTITTTVISIHCWKLHHWHCEISNQDLFVSVFLSSLSLHFLVFYVMPQQMRIQSFSWVSNAFMRISTFVQPTVNAQSKENSTKRNVPMWICIKKGKQMKKKNNMKMFKWKFRTFGWLNSQDVHHQIDRKV